MENNKNFEVIGNEATEVVEVKEPGMFTKMFNAFKAIPKMTVGDFCKKVATPVIIGGTLVAIIIKVATSDGDKDIEVVMNDDGSFTVMDTVVDTVEEAVNMISE